MTLDEAIKRYLAISEGSKTRFLLLLSYELTVYMRGCYDEGDAESRATKLKGANEVQHRLAAEARHHLALNLERYPDDVLIRICAELASVYKIEAEFGGAMNWALDRNEWSEL